MKTTLTLISLILVTSSSFASNLTIAQSLLANKQIMDKATSIAMKEAQASEFYSIEVVSDSRQYQATLTFVPKKQTWTSVFRHSVTVTGRTDGQTVLSVNRFVSSGE